MKLPDAPVAPVQSGDAAPSGAARAWSGLEAHASLPTQALIFFSALASSFLADSVVEVMQVMGAGGVVALIPLCRERRIFARWRMAGAREVFEPCDVLCASPQDASALAGRLARQSRPLVLDRIPVDSPLLPALRDAMKGRGFVRLSPATPCPTIPLDETWVEPEARFNSGRRSDFRRACRRAESLGVVTLEVLSPDPEAFATLFDEAIAIEARSWKQAAGTAIAADRDKEDFFRAYLGAAAAEGTLRMAFLRIDGTPIAMQLALEWQGRFWLFKIGYDEAYGKCSPGTLLMLHTLGWAARRGLTGYELMGDVEPWIAALWTRDAHPCARVQTYPANLRGAVAFLADSLGWLAGRLPWRRR